MDVPFHRIYERRICRLRGPSQAESFASEILILIKGGPIVEERQTQRAHKVILNNRKSGTISGVSAVLSFDIKEILLETDQGMLMIKGNDLHVNRLTLEKGEVDIEGQIDSLTYSDVSGYANKGESLLGRLFK